MDQSVIEIMKRHYRRQLLRKLLIEDENEEGIVAHRQKLYLKDCSYMVAEVWNLVKTTTLKRAWNKLKGLSTKDEMTLEDLRKILLKIPGFQSVGVETDDQKDDVTTESYVGLSAGEVFACLETVLT
ncbi:hypothetical protein PR048_002820 [Dryococelus australis]|uniref:DDE-1 domain-containing protein n=1 Tax=Dryococelus australis TaxID=614101 RepID=A0ABQ9IMQ0_9NEOP|nr:hypothetical protein PR048_002820 [Dryococelus australis]